MYEYSCVPVFFVDESQLSTLVGVGLEFVDSCYPGTEYLLSFSGADVTLEECWFACAVGSLIFKILEAEVCIYLCFV